MKIKRKFAISNIMMLITPIVLIGVVSLCFITAFVIAFPVEELQISRKALMEPEFLIRAAGDFITRNPDSVIYIFLWAVISILILVVSITLITVNLSRSIQTPIDELKKAADNVKSGKLDFDMLVNDEYDEFSELFRVFDEMRRELKRARMREKIMREERSMLMANISHDIKTPVTSIKGYIDGIRDGVADTPEKMEKYLDTIYAKAVTIDDMVNNLSTYSKLELSKLRFNFIVTDINDFLTEVLEEYRLDLEKNDMELKTELCEKRLQVKIDPEQMFRVVANILDNAIKYKKEGRGYIEISTKQESGGVIIRIADRGIGIDEDELEAVFDEFYRVDRARNMNIKGSGLGLGIAKQIVKAHNGSIWLKSGDGGEGTAAMIYLPAVESAV